MICISLLKKQITKKPEVKKYFGLKKNGDDILSRFYPVPSALLSLTSLFGMGRGEPQRNNHHKSLLFYLSYFVFAQHDN